MNILYVRGAKTFKWGYIIIEPLSNVVRYVEMVCFWGFCSVMMGILKMVTDVIKTAKWKEGGSAQ